MCICSQLLKVPPYFSEKNFFLEFDCLTGKQKEKEKWSSLPWLNPQQRQICRAQKKSAWIQSVEPDLCLYQTVGFFVFSEAGKVKWFIIMLSRYYSNETISKPIHKPTKNQMKWQLKGSVQSFYQVCCFGYCVSQGLLQEEKERGRQSMGMPRQKVTRPKKTNVKN